MDLTKYASKVKMKMPPRLSENEIEGIYLSMRNQGEFYIGQLGGDPVNIDEWRERELKKLKKLEL